MSAAPQNPLSSRIVSLDQFRGYTILGMFLVNYMGSYKAFVPNILLHHNTYCSYADLIMPHFLFCVGFAFRLTFGRRDYKDGPAKAYFRVVRRILGLFLVAFSVYHTGRIANTWDQLTHMTFWEIFEGPMKRTWLQTLGQIALTSLWILPWLRTSLRTRILFMIGSGVGHHIACYYGYFLYANTGPSGIDGGPLGFLTWTIPSILGTIACDWVVDAREGENQRHAPIGKMFVWSVIVMLLGWFITFPARLYDITPAEMADLKENVYKHHDRVNGVSGAKNKPLGEKLKPFNKLVGDQSGELRKQDFKKKQEIVARMMTEQGLDEETDYPGEAIQKAAIAEWEAKYTKEPENPVYEEELGALHQKLDYYQEMLKPEIIRPDDKQEARKLQSARKFEEMVTAEIDRKKEIRNPLMVEAKLDPEKDDPTAPINKQTEEQFTKEPGEKVTALRAEVEAMKIPYQEEFSVYYKNLVKTRTKLNELETAYQPQEDTTKKPIFDRLMTEASLNPESDKPTDAINKAVEAELVKALSEDQLKLRKEFTEQKQLVTHLESLTEMEWNKLGSYGWRDYKLAENPVAFDASRWKTMDWKQKIGRNPMAKPEYENRQVEDYQARDTFYWNAWMMSQRAGTVAYLVFAGGASLFFYTLFYIACDMKGLQIPLFRTWGTNALACYVLFELVCGGVKNFVPRDPEPWYGWASWVLGMFLMWVVIRSFEKNKIFIRM